MTIEKITLYYDGFFKRLRGALKIIFFGRAETGDESSIRLRIKED